MNQINSIEEFPNVLYKGNSATVEYSMQTGNRLYTFQPGDSIKLAIAKELTGIKVVQKTYEIQNEATTISLYLTPEDTKDIEPGHAILEIAVKYNNDADFKTVYQNKIELKGVIIDGSE